MNRLSLLCTIMTSFVQILTLTRGQSGENFTKVMQDFTHVDERVRPVRDFFTVTEVSVSFHLMAIIHFNNVDQKLISTGWFEVTWVNEYTTWNPLEYGGVYSVRPDPDTVWRPKITIQNTMKDLKPIGEDYVAIMTFYDGTTYWFPAELFETFCEVDVTYFPFDIQSCRWDIFIWEGQDGSVTDLNPIIPTIDLDTFVVNGEWELMSTRAWREVRIAGGFNYTFLNYEVTLRRRPSLLALTVLLPVVVLAVVNVYVFTIPSEAGERLAYSMTSLLSFGVFMSFIMDSMPSSTSTLSIVAVNMSCLLTLSAIYVLLCILSLRFFHRDSSKHPVPSVVQSIIIWLEILVCLDPPTKNKVSEIVHVQPVVDPDSTDIFGRQKEPGVAVKKLQYKLDKWAMARFQNRAAYTDPAEMTWRRVSRSLDKLLFRFFFCLVFVSNLTVWLVLLGNYYH